MPLPWLNDKNNFLWCCFSELLFDNFKLFQRWVFISLQNKRWIFFEKELFLKKLQCSHLVYTFFLFLFSLFRFCCFTTRIKWHSQSVSKIRTLCVEFVWNNFQLLCAISVAIWITRTGFSVRSSYIDTIWFIPITPYTHWLITTVFCL